MADKDDDKTTAAKPSTAPSTGNTRPASERAEARPEPRTQALAVDADNPEIDPRLDNRTGKQRPKLEEFPAKPQQIDGPELGQEKTFAGKRDEHADNTPRKGAKSPGPHGLGDTADQV